MVDKSNEYGYIPSSPTQAIGANTGVFEVNDIVDLLAAQQWSGDFGSLELIQTQTLADATYATTEVDFTDLGNYKVHLLTQTNLKNNGYMYTALQLSVGGTFQTTGYYSAHQRIEDNSTGSIYTQSNDANIVFGLYTYRGSNTYVWLYNLLDVNEKAFVNFQTVGIEGNNAGVSSGFGGGFRNTNAAYDGIRITHQAGVSLGGYGTWSLYGLKDSV